MFGHICKFDTILILVYAYPSRDFSPNLKQDLSGFFRLSKRTAQTAPQKRTARLYKELQFRHWYSGFKAASLSVAFFSCCSQWIYPLRAA